MRSWALFDINGGISYCTLAIRAYVALLGPSVSNGGFPTRNSKAIPPMPKDQRLLSVLFQKPSLAANNQGFHKAWYV